MLIYVSVRRKPVYVYPCKPKFLCTKVGFKGGGGGGKTI